MPELAWLSCLKGEWLLVTRGRECEFRKWSDAHLALRDLADEGWIVTKPLSRTPGASHSRQHRLLGYCLKRTIH